MQNLETPIDGMEARRDLSLLSLLSYIPLQKYATQKHLCRERARRRRGVEAQ